MKLRLPLFGKIFIGFWLATVAVLGSWLLFNQYFDDGPDRAAIGPPPHGQPQRFVMRMLYDLQNLGMAQLRDTLARVKVEHDLDIYLLDASGSELLGRAVPEAVRQVAAQLHGPRQRAFLRAARVHLLGHEIYRPDTGVVRAVFVFRPDRHRLMALLGSSLWLRIVVAVMVSGLVCYFLSRLLTGRIRELQAASRRLATGDLTARLQVRDAGGDETDELARDFNSMATQLQERIHAQKRLLTDVSHELRSPLARLRIALALAQSRPASAPDHLERIERETGRLEELIGQLLDSQSGDGPLDDHLDLVPLLQQLCSDANFEGAAEHKVVLLEHAVGEAVVASTGDLLRQGLENILRNALGHTPPRSTVRVTLDTAGDDYRIRVEDSGSGVEEAELDRIFETFYRTDLARSRDTGGYGLGLAIARRAVLRHGGQIEAGNTPGGFRISITLPASADAVNSPSQRCRNV